MESITVTTKETSYNIQIGANILKSIGKLVDAEKYSQNILITDDNVGPLYADTIEQVLPKNTIRITIQHGETNKNIQTLETIHKQLLKNQCDRKTLIINLGGGVICDMGGFAATTYMRGVDFAHIPTTLLSQVDAGIGGKVGVNFEGIKNLLGAFTQPQAVAIDVDTLKTLPEREFNAGFAEIIKHGLIQDKKFFENVVSKKPKNFTREELIQIIKTSCQIKRDVVEKDEKETGLRKILNFGHTIGHAVESLSHETKNPLLHGEAISVGMLAEAKLSHKLGLLSEKKIELIQDALQNANLPTKIPESLDPDKILLKTSMDKKNENGETRFTLLKDIGKTEYDIPVDIETINNILNS